MLCQFKGGLQSSQPVILPASPASHISATNGRNRPKPAASRKLSMLPPSPTPDPSGIIRHKPGDPIPTRVLKPQTRPGLGRGPPASYSPLLGGVFYLQSSISHRLPA